MSKTPRFRRLVAAVACAAISPGLAVATTVCGTAYARGDAFSLPSFCEGDHPCLLPLVDIDRREARWIVQTGTDGRFIAAWSPDEVVTSDPRRFEDRVAAGFGERFEDEADVSTAVTKDLGNGRQVIQLAWPTLAGSNAPEPIRELANLAPGLLAVDLVASTPTPVDQPLFELAEADSLARLIDVPETLDDLTSSAGPETAGLVDSETFSCLERPDITPAEESITVAVIDSGMIDSSNLVLARSQGFFVCNREPSGWTCGTSNDVLDTHGHGTKVASLITHPALGVAPGIARVLPLRVFDQHGCSTVSNLEQAVRHAAARAQIIVGAWKVGSAGTENLRRAIENATDSLFVFAAGNGTTVTAPASWGLANAIAVGGITKDCATHVDAHGVAIDILAPSRSIRALNLLNVPERGNAGTSFAAALAAGSASLVWSETVDPNPRTVRDRLIATAEGSFGTCDDCGRIDIACALGQDPEPRCALPPAPPP